MKKNKAGGLFQEVETTISEFGVESIEVADLFLRLNDSLIGRVVEKTDDPLVHFDMPVDKGLSLSWPTPFDWYIFGDSSLTETRVKQIEAAFAFAAPAWAETNPEALDSAANILRNVAEYYKLMSAFEKWEVFNRRILNIFITLLGHNHRTVVHWLGDMGAHYLAVGKLDEADASFREALTICEADSDLQVSESPGLLLNSAGVAFMRGEIVIARLLLDQLMEVLEQAPIMDKVVLLEALVNYAAVFRATENLEEFDRVSLGAEDVAKEVWKSKPMSVVTPALALIRSNEALARFEDAERLMQWLMAEMESLAGSKGKQYAHVRVRARFLNDCRENGLPVSLEKIDPQTMADLLG